MEAAYYGFVDVVRLLLGHPRIEVNIETLRSKRTALWEAYFKMHLEIVKLLLNHPKIDVEKGMPADGKPSNIAKLLFDYTIVEMSKNEELLVAAITGNLTTVEMDEEIDVNTIDRDEFGLVGDWWAEYF